MDNRSSKGGKQAKALFEKSGLFEKRLFGLPYSVVKK
jgi:hypothetical protein